MNSVLNVAGVRRKIIWLAFFLFWLSILALMLSSLFTSWVETSIPTTLSQQDLNPHNPNYSRDLNFAGNHFRGSLHKCERGCSNSYFTQKSDWCDSYYDENNIVVCYAYETCRIMKSMCNTFEDLWKAGIIYTIFESIAAFSTVIVLIYMCLIIFKVKFGNFLGLCSSLFVLLLHAIAIITWIIIVGEPFPRDCNTFPDDGSKITLCYSIGPIIGIFLLIWIFIVFLLSLLVFYYNQDADNGLQPQGSEDQSIHVGHNQ